MAIRADGGNRGCNGMRFILFVEGETEELGVAGFLKSYIDSRLVDKVGITTVRFNGWSELHDNAPKMAAKQLRDPKSDEVTGVISLLDLYGPTFYPRDMATVQQRYGWGRAYMEDRVQRYFRDNGVSVELAEKYKHFFAVHEIEAWFVSQPSLFRDEVKAALAALKRKPEEINFDAPPCKLLEKLHMQLYKKRYRKTKNALNFFPKLNVDEVAAKCPYLKLMLDELVAMAIAAGATPVNNSEEP
jgi:hypothetical protein